jgi:hypothetical protein
MRRTGLGARRTATARGATPRPGRSAITITGCTAGTYFTKTITGVQVGAGKTRIQNAGLVSG